MRKPKIPNDEQLRSNLVQITSRVERSAEILALVVRNSNDDCVGIVESINRLGKEGDELTLCMDVELAKTRLPPSVRQNYRELARSLRELLELISLTALGAMHCRLKRPMPVTAEMCRLLLNQVKEIARAMARYDDRDQLREVCIEIDHLGNCASRLLQSGTGLLSGEDMVEVIARKRIFECVEKATDKAEDIAQYFYSLVLKSA